MAYCILVEEYEHAEDEDGYEDYKIPISLDFHERVETSFEDAKRTADYLAYTEENNFDRDIDPLIDFFAVGPCGTCDRTCPGRASLESEVSNV